MIRMIHKVANPAKTSSIITAIPPLKEVSALPISQGLVISSTLKIIKDKAAKNKLAKNLSEPINTNGIS